MRHSDIFGEPEITCEPTKVFTKKEIDQISIILISRRIYCRYDLTALRQCSSGSKALPAPQENPAPLSHYYGGFFPFRSY